MGILWGDGKRIAYGDHCIGVRPLAWVVSLGNPGFAPILYGVHLRLADSVLSSNSPAGRWQSNLS